MPALPDLLSKAARRFPERTAVRIIGRAPVSYRELADRIEALAGRLWERGVRPGDRIAVRAANGLVHFDAYLAAARLGAAAVPIGADWAAEEAGYVLENARPALGFADSEGAEALAASGLEVLVWGSSEYRAALTAEGGAPPRPDPEAAALIIYTSGTTGRPKGVRLSHRAVICNAASAALSQEFSPHEVYLTSTPLYHTSAGLRVFTMLGGGHTHVVMPRFDAAAWLEAVEEHRVTSTIAVPAQIGRILDDPGFGPERLASMRLLLYGAAPSTRRQLLRMLKELPCGLYHGYGLTEAAGLVTALGAADHRALEGPDDPRLGSVGRPLPGVEASVRRPDGAEAEPGEAGEITVRSGKVMSGYWEDEAASAAALRGGRLLTGDLATADEEGFLTIVGRMQEVIISGGVNIYPAQVERVINAHPQVAEAAVFGLADERWGEAPAAAVRLHPGRPGPPPAAEDIRALVAGRLDRRARPRRVVFVEDFPRTAAGKIRRRELASLIDRPQAESGSRPGGNPPPPPS